MKLRVEVVDQQAIVHLVGAGGGGFLLLYATNPSDTRQAMAAAGSLELVFDFEFGGAQATVYT